MDYDDLPPDSVVTVTIMASKVDRKLEYSAVLVKKIDTPTFEVNVMVTIFGDFRQCSVKIFLKL
jgi:hypothetical protein